MRILNFVIGGYWLITLGAYIDGYEPSKFIIGTSMFITASYFFRISLKEE